MIVLDASVAVKLFREEAGSDLAHTIIEDHGGHIAVPDLFAIEVASALVREANILKNPSSESSRKLAHLCTLLTGSVIEPRRPSAEDIRRAAITAIELGHPLKDCLYIILAMELECPLVTADARFATKARTVWHRVQMLGE